MGVLAAEQIGELLRRYFREAVPDWEQRQQERPELLEKLAVYLDLVARWNRRMNLSAIRQPEEIVRRHFGESLFVAQAMASEGCLLDLGSGAGFPGIPVQLWHPGLLVTLAESQGKKAGFLREVVRVLGLRSEVWAGRAEEMVSAHTFDAVVMRAVDIPERALRTGLALTKSDVWLLGSEISLRALPDGVTLVSRRLIPGTDGSFLFQLRREVFHVEQRC